MAERYAAGSREARIVEAQKYVYCHTRSATRLGNRHRAFGAVVVSVLVALQSFLNLKARSEAHKRFAADWHRLLEHVELRWDNADIAKIAELNEAAYQLRAAHPVFPQQLWDSATAHWGHVIQSIK